ncbi:Chitin binding Peritrophin-A domain [Popillia japonica]|uniref:Chitin binding Peritrophin-A domain n=1 Tax=Popillia japonica TaxID=7064 RepID=A0AAW1JYB8_POPJA
MLSTVANCGLVLVGFLLTLALQEDVQVKFSCQGRPAGYYADVESGCQIYHMCDGLGRQFSYSCPNTTLFQQRMLICDHWYMVNCSRSEDDYTANLLIGQHKPFVEDSEKQTYYRTPRPDLLTQPTASELNIIYRKGRVQNQTDLNLVGINSDSDQNNGSSRVTDKPTYQLPSHWSTEYYKAEATTASSVNNNISPAIEVNNHISIPFDQARDTEARETRRPVLVPIPKAINFNSNNLDNAIKSKPRQLPFSQRNPVFPTKNELGTTESPVNGILDAPLGEKDIKQIVRVPHPDFNVNFNSLFKATTPVFPTKEELGTTESPLGDIIIPPNSGNQFPNQNIVVNFHSLFKATTPVFPTKEELGTTESPVDGIVNPPISRNQNEVKKDETVVNFSSLFKATTPVFPTKEQLGTTESPVDGIVNPPVSGDENNRRTINDIIDQDVVVNFNSLFKATTPVFPTKNELGTTESPIDGILNPPYSDSEQKFEKLDSNKFKPKTKISSRLNNDKVLKELRKMFSIPDYEFPLDTMIRPDYGHPFDSFHVNPFLADVQPRQHAS